MILTRVKKSATVSPPVTLIDAALSTTSHLQKKRSITGAMELAPDRKKDRKDTG